MITLSQALRAILTPFLVAALLAALGRWRRWRWMMPAAFGTAFLAGYGLLAVPQFKPIDGTDWLFWLAIPVTALGALEAILLPKWGWALGAAAGVVAWVIINPLVPNAVSASACWTTAIVTAIAGAGLLRATGAVEPRIGARAVTAGLLAAVGGAAVDVLASDSASIGIRGLAGAAALAPLVVLTIKGERSSRGVSIIAIAILSGVLVSGHFYAGVTWLQLAVLGLSPLLLLAGAAVPSRRPRLAGTVAVIAVIAAIAPVVVPAAIAAKHAAESNADDPYG